MLIINHCTKWMYMMILNLQLHPRSWHGSVSGTKSQCGNWISKKFSSYFLLLMQLRQIIMWRVWRFIKKRLICWCLLELEAKIVSLACISCKFFTQSPPPLFGEHNRVVQELPIHHMLHAHSHRLFVKYSYPLIPL